MASHVIPNEVFDFTNIPESGDYVLLNCSVPIEVLRSGSVPGPGNDDDLVLCNIHIESGKISKITPSTQMQVYEGVDLEGGCVFPTFMDLHTHIGVPRLPTNYSAGTCRYNLGFTIMQ